LILDVDGVMTDGKKFYDKEGNVVLKNFCDKDWTAIKRFKAANVDVFFITGDPFNAKILENRNLPFIVNRGSGFHNDKSNFLKDIIQKYNIDVNQTIYVGDDVFDIKIMQQLKYSFCPSDAPNEVKKYSISLHGTGGENLIKELFDLLQEKQLITVSEFDAELIKIYDLDIKESF
jgi:3-deoxy-D-manno-octulosonate 8-phosphate phosphatase (KDO 8-P phosphatase)